MVPTLIGISIVVFMMVRFLPGSRRRRRLGENAAVSVEDRAKLRDQYKLSNSLPQQYWDWLKGVAHGDLGVSLISNRSVAKDLRHRIVPSVELGLMAMTVALLIAIPVGVISAVRQDTWLDYVARSGAIGFLSVPGFWLATLILVIPSRLWGWTPPLEYRDFTESPVQNLYKLAIPAGLVGLALVGTIMRLTRTQMLEVLRQDYIRTAYAKGLRQSTTIFRHALKNALIPVITVIGLQIPTLIGGIVIMETIFDIPGMGSYLFDATFRRDYPAIQGVNLVVAGFVLLSNLFVDISYSYLDPRIRYS